jgi:hypothetical protein
MLIAQPNNFGMKYVFGWDIEVSDSKVHLRYLAANVIGSGLGLWRLKAWNISEKYMNHAA